MRFFYDNLNRLKTKNSFKCFSIYIVYYKLLWRYHSDVVFWSKYAVCKDKDGALQINIFIVISFVFIFNSKIYINKYKIVDTFLSQLRWRGGDG